MAITCFGYYYHIIIIIIIITFTTLIILFAAFYPTFFVNVIIIVITIIISDVTIMERYRYTDISCTQSTVHFDTIHVHRYAYIHVYISSK